MACQPTVKRAWRSGGRPMRPVARDEVDVLSGRHCSPLSLSGHRLSRPMASGTGIALGADNRRQATSFGQFAWCCRPEFIDDGRWHTLIVRRSVPAEASQLLLALESRDTRSCFHLRRLAFCTTWQDAGTAIDVDQSAAADEHDFHQIDLSGRFDASYTKRVERMLARDADPVVRDGGSFFRRSPIRIGGVPYQVATDRDNLIAHPPEPAANKEIIDNYGLRVQPGGWRRSAGSGCWPRLPTDSIPIYFGCPAWYDPVKKEFRFRPILEEFRRKSGTMPTWCTFGDGPGLRAVITKCGGATMGRSTLRHWEGCPPSAARWTTCSTDWGCRYHST